MPEAYIAAILLSLPVQLFLPLPVFRSGWIGHLTGWPPVIIGIFLALWSASEAGKMHISSPDRLISTGPFAVSRNPMYVGWALIYTGYALIINSVWALALFPAAFLYVHFLEIRREEKYLQEKFGTLYDAYRKKVRRYL